jgi:hypothetical protein
VFKKYGCQQHFLINKMIDIFMTRINKNIMQIAEIHAGRGKKKITHVDIMLKS